MIKEKIKNLHYLEMYSSIKDNFVSAVESSDNDNIYGLIYLKDVIEELCLKLSENDINRNKTTFKDIILNLEFSGTLTSEQSSLFISILDLSSKYVHGFVGSAKVKQDLESLRNFCVRMDKELPSLMAHLGVGGASRSKYINKNRIRKRRDIVKTNNYAVSKDKYSFANKYRKKKILKRVFIISIISIIAISLISGLSYIRKNSINVVERLKDKGSDIINDFIPNTTINISSKIDSNTSFAGVNGKGSLYYLSNNNILYSDKTISIYQNNEMINIVNNENVVIFSSSLQVNKNSGLSNGDEVSIIIPQNIIDILSNHNISLAINSVIKTVSGLIDIQDIENNKESIVNQVNEFARNSAQKQTNDSLKWTSSVKKVYFVPSYISNSHKIVAYICFKKTFYNAIVGQYFDQYFINKYEFGITNDATTVNTTDFDVEELSLWSSEYDPNKVAQDFEIFYKDSDPITLK